MSMPAVSTFCFNMINFRKEAFFCTVYISYPNLYLK